MDGRKIEALKFGDEVIYVEVSEIEQTGVKPAASAYENTSTESDLMASGEQVGRTIQALATTLHKALYSAAPEEWTLEINLGFKGQAGIPFIAQGEANGAIKVTAKWKRS